MFGVTGDLSRKKLMPAIYDLANRGLLPPGFALVGFARRDWADQDFAEEVHRRSRSTRGPRSARRSGASCPRASASCSGEFGDDAGLPGAQGDHRRARRRARAPTATTRSTCRCRRSSSPAWSSSCTRSACDQGPEGSWRRVVIEKPFGHDLASRPGAQRDRGRGLPAPSRSSASTTTWARRRSRTSWRCGSPTRCSSRSGTATTSTTCRSRWPRTSASAAGPGTTTASARRATSSRTTCCSCWR